MKLFKRALAAVLCIAAVVSVMSISSVGVSAADNLFYAFSDSTKISQNGVKSISYTSNGMRIVSDDDNIQNCNGRLPESAKSYIQAVYDLSGEATQSALATVQSDKTVYRVSLEFNLHKVIGVKSMKNPNSKENELTYKDWNRKRDADGNYTDTATVANWGFGVEAIVIFTGKDADGNIVNYKNESTVSTVEHPKKTLVTNLPKSMASIDSVTIRFGQGSDAVTAVKSLDCEVSNITVTKLSTPTNPIQDPNSDCIIDFTDAYQIYQLGSNRMAYSGMVTMTVDESSELYPNSAASFYGKGYVGPDCFNHGWEDMGVGAEFKQGSLKDYDGIQCYVISRKTDKWTVGFLTVGVTVMLPNRDGKGNYLDANGNKVGSINDAYFFPWYFMIPENKTPAAHAGTVMKFTFDFNNFETGSLTDLTKTAERLGIEIGEYYDDAIEKKTLNLNDYKQYAYKFAIGKGLYAFTGKDVVVDFSVGDVYGCKYDKYGDLTSNMPEPAAYVDPNAGNNTIDEKAIQRFVELYEELPKDIASYYNDADGKLKSKLYELLSIWGSMGAKTRKELELTYGYTETDYANMAMIWDTVYGATDGPSSIDLDFGDSSLFDNPDSGVSWPVALAVTAIGAGAMLVAVRKSRKKDNDLK